MRIPVTFILWWLILFSYSQTTRVWERTISGGANFSSPVFTPDLNGDGVGDLVLGSGVEGNTADSGIIALSGLDGATLWVRQALDQIFTTPHFFDVTQDQVPDVFIGGRNAQMMLLNGKNGETIWEFRKENGIDPADSTWFNFYTPIFTRDLTGDKIPELIITNGGNSEAKASDTIRPAGKLIVLNGATGNILSLIETPDRQETYFSPLYFVTKQHDTLVVFGTGGETVQGHLYGIPLSDLVFQDTSNLVTLLTGSKKGFIASPIVLPGQNNTETLIVPQLDKGIVSIESTSLQSTDEFTDRGSEFYVTPVPLGDWRVVDSETINALTWLSAKGVFPFYSSYRTSTRLEGAGSHVFDSTFGIYQLMSPNAMDINGDGRDDLVIAVNYDVGTQAVQYRNRLFYVDPYTSEWRPLVEERKGLMLYAQPLFTQLDANSKTDLIVISNNNESNWYNHKSYTVSRYEFTSPEPLQGSWPAYRGSNGDGRLVLKSKQVNTISSVQSALIMYPNPSKHTVFVNSRSCNNVQLFSTLGRQMDCTFSKTKRRVEVDLSRIPSGTYYLVVTVESGQSIQKHLVILPK